MYGLHSDAVIPPTTSPPLPPLPNHHPTLLLAVASPNLTHIRQESHGLSLSLLAETCPQLHTLHLRDPTASATGTLTPLRALRHLTIGTGNWEPWARFAGAPGGGGESGAWDVRRGAGVGMRGSQAPHAAGFLDVDGVGGARETRMRAVRRLMLSLDPAGRARLVSLAIGEVALEDVRGVFCGTRVMDTGDVDMANAALTPTEGDAMEEEEEGVAWGQGTMEGQGSMSPFARVANRLAQEAAPSPSRVLMKPAPFSSLTRLWLRVIPRLGLDLISAIMAQTPLLEWLDVSFAGPVQVEALVVFAQEVHCAERVVIALWIMEREFREIRVGEVEREVNRRGLGVFFRFACDLND
ncbi:hypothetical protein BC830DRAFT_1114453 [Chytriomyces sp. MP71]|nr:hypothetical protein BC830DRAFT_1114453 [Chytriomyces sp. MP71]